MEGIHDFIFTEDCKKCSLTYNYNKWGDKSKISFVYYDEPADYVEVNDTTYFVRSLLDLQCSLA